MNGGVCSLRNCSGSSKKLSTNVILVDDNQCLENEGVDCSSHRMRAFVWDFEGSRRVSYVPNGIL